MNDTVKKAIENLDRIVNPRHHGGIGSEEDKPDYGDINRLIKELKDTQIWLSEKNQTANGFMNQVKKLQAAVKTKPIWIAWSNTDTNEGRGEHYPLAISESRAAVIRLGKRGSVQGCDCDISPFNAVEVEGRFLAPFYAQPSTKEDDQADVEYQSQQQAIARAKAAGLDEQTIQILLGSGQ